MASYSVTWEIELDAENPLEAAKQAQEILQDKSKDWQYYTQDDDGQVSSVDLQEEDEDAVLPVDKYEPLIK